MIKTFLREYQKEIINVVLERVAKNVREVLIEMPTGSGKNIVIKELVKDLNNSNNMANILLLTSSKFVELQYAEELEKYKSIEISNYCRKAVIDKDFSYVIIDDAERISEEKYINICNKFKKSILVFFCSTLPKNKKDRRWMDEKNIDYSLSMERVIKEGYINPFQMNSKFQDFVEKMLEYLCLDKIDKEVVLKGKNIAARLDFVLENCGSSIIVETKCYRSNYVQSTFIYQAVEQMQYYRELWRENKHEEAKAVLILSCQVSDEFKEICYKEKGILIIDISNLLFLAKNDEDLLKDLTESIQNSMYDVIPKAPLVSEIFDIKRIAKKKKIIEETNEAIDYIYRLENLHYGKVNGNDKEYEKLCVDMIKFLFKSEFTKMVEQNSTEDKMFRMDLVCGLKGASEFWKILMQHYNTRFVVFEFKNYEDEIDQNLIYITEKYLYNAVLRNVAIVVSRMGFSHNALKAATGILTENGKLIIGLNDNDIITMLRMKADGQDPSDYMINMLENYLMSISK